MRIRFHDGSITITSTYRGVAMGTLTVRASTYEIIKVALIHDVAAFQRRVRSSLK